MAVARELAFLCWCFALVSYAVHASDLNSFTSACDSAFCKIVDDSSKDISELRSSLEGGSCIPQLGQKADSICNTALERFTNEVPPVGNDPSKEAFFDKRIEDLERTLDAPLQVVYLRQLALLRDKALQRFKSSAKGTESSDYETMVATDEYFRTEAEESSRQGSDWDYTAERTSLQNSMNEIAQRSKKVADAKVKAAQQQASAMQFLQMQQQQIAALQQQIYGSGSRWTVGGAYRIPDTSINLAATHQQGRTSVQLSSVPDDSASLLGPNGFVHGVGPGNLGLSANINF